MAHREWCNKKTHQTTCKYCRKKVYYFSCDCGSKVFFDKLGGYLPKHNCMETTTVYTTKKEVHKPKVILIKKTFPREMTGFLGKNNTDGRNFNNVPQRA